MDVEPMLLPGGSGCLFLLLDFESLHTPLWIAADGSYTILPTTNIILSHSKSLAFVNLLHVSTPSETIGSNYSQTPHATTHYPQNPTPKPYLIGPGAPFRGQPLRIPAIFMIETSGTGPPLCGIATSILPKHKTSLAILVSPYQASREWDWRLRMPADKKNPASENKVRARRSCH